MSKTTFTPAEANRTLPLVQRIVADILDTGQRLRELAQFDDARAAPALAEGQRDLRRLTRELEHIGCEYKDWSFDKGLVDFPGEIDGRAVLLCWRSDEPAVAWYHTPEAGYRGRKRIPQELLVEG